MKITAKQIEKLCNIVNKAIDRVIKLGTELIVKYNEAGEHIVYLENLINILKEAKTKINGENK